MKMRSYVTVAVGLFCIIALLQGCATSGLVKQWSDTSFRGPSLSNILVVAVAKDPVKRRVWEDAFVAGLAKLAVNAVPSYRLFPEAIPDSSQMPAAVAQYAFNGIIVTRRLPKTVSTTYVAGYVSTESETKYSRRRQEFRTYYHDVEHPGYIDTQKVANRSIDVWTAGADSRPIWSAVSETTEPTTLEDMNRDVVNLVVGDLLRKGLVIKAK
jgi:hypothetical protein